MGEGGFELPEDYRNDDLSPAPWSQTKNHTRLDHPPTLRERIIDYINRYKFYLLYNTNYKN